MSFNLEELEALDRIYQRAVDGSADRECKIEGDGREFVFSLSKGVGYKTYAGSREMFEWYSIRGDSLKHEFVLSEFRRVSGRKITLVPLEVVVSTD